MKDQLLWIVCDSLPGPDGAIFIDVEDGRGNSHGADVGINWVQRENGAAQLGPFVSATEAQTMISRLETKLFSLKHECDLWRAKANRGRAVVDADE